MKIRKVLRVLHRDIGYFITGMVLIYAISGIALNHRKDWNPHHIIIREEIKTDRTGKKIFSKEDVVKILEAFDHLPVYKKHFIANNGLLKVFIENGMVTYNPMTGFAEMEFLKKRPVFYQINKLHIAGTKRIWVWISDVMSVLLIFVTVSGLFLLKGKKGITGKGLWYIVLGFLIPGIFLLFYM